MKVWEKAHALTLDVYRATLALPHEERYGLTSQARRPSASIPANIAEGCGKNSDADFARHVQIAIGAASESEHRLLLAKDLGLLDPARHHALIERAVEVRKVLIALASTLRTKTSP